MNNNNNNNNNNNSNLILKSRVYACVVWFCVAKYSNEISSFKETQLPETDRRNKMIVQ
jgi:hypothetical protein